MATYAGTLDRPLIYDDKEGIRQNPEARKYYFGEGMDIHQSHTPPSQPHTHPGHLHPIETPDTHRR